MVRGWASRLAVVVGGALLTVSCASAAAGDEEPVAESSTSEPSTTSTTVPPDTTTTTTTTPTTTSTTTTTTTTTSTTTTTTTTTTTLPPPVEVGPAADPNFGATLAAFDRLARANAGASLSVARGGELVLQAASGPTIDGLPATTATPVVIASVSKLMLAAAVARLDQRGVLDVDTPMPWADLGIEPHPQWQGVTIRELLDHSAGMPVLRPEWFRGGLTCAFFLPGIVAAPPTATRGEWRYSNGNYCALGLLVEHVTGQVAVEAVNDEVFRPLGLAGAHTTEGGLLPGDMYHAKPVERLSRLGAAGTFVVSSDDLALALSRLTDADRDVLRQPAVFTDQYGFGHTGTIDGSKACTWVLENGGTVMSAVIAGNSVATGGRICDLLLPALARDIGLSAGTPDRWP